MQGPPSCWNLTKEFTQWYLQVDAGLVASHVWRLKFLHKDDNDADEEHKVNLRSKEKAVKMVLSKAFAHPCHYTGCYSLNKALFPSVKIPSRLIMAAL